MRFSFFLVQLVFISMLYSQEACDNGTDDDGDGLVDCYDAECSSDGECGDSFIGNTFICSGEPNEFLTIKEAWSSEDKTSSSYASPMVGDLDQDGKPEVISVNSFSKRVFILSGQSGVSIATYLFDFEPSGTPLTADIDNDGSAEIFVTEENGSDYVMLKFSENSLNPLWFGKASLDQSIGVPGIADFDEDGDAEIYYRNEVVDANTGEVLIAGSGNWVDDWTHASIAVDILPSSQCADCSGLELVTGNEIWAVNESNRTLELARNMDDDILTDIDSDLRYFPKYNGTTGNQWSAASSVDYNLDGNLDLLITGALGTSEEAANGESTIFFWDVQNSNIQTFSDPANDPDEGAGRIAVEDIDLDGAPNAVFSMGVKVYALDENLDIFWTHDINASNTAVTVFDLNGDSANEILIKDGDQLLVLRGSGNGDNTTSVERTATCKAITQEEPIVIADIDGDGSVEICMACLTDDEASTGMNSNAEFSQIRAFEADGLGWVPGRSVWNQYSYYNVNINDNLTVPVETQDHSVVFSSGGTCDFADGSVIPYPSRVLNTFGAQSTIISDNGCREIASADLDFVGIVSVSDLNCFGESRVAIEITNIGDKNLYGGELNVSYYLGDPRTVDGILLDSRQVEFDQLEISNQLIIEETISGIPDGGEIFVMLNDPGSTPPIEVPFNDILIRECEVDNNLQSTLAEYSTSADKISVAICEGETFEFGTQSLTEAGEYTETFPDADGICQEVTLTLTINPTYTETVLETICLGDSYSFGSMLLTEPGDYSNTFQSISSCDSVVNLSLTIQSITAEASLSNGILSVVPVDNATYQWINCDTQEEIDQAAGVDFAPSASGSYAVRIETETCEVLSECFDVIVLNASDSFEPVIFPNPIFDYIMVDLPRIASGTYQLLDLTGKSILNESFNHESKIRIETKQVKSGFYVLEFIIGNQRKQFKITKD